MLHPLSRREFLAASGISAGALLAAPALGQAPKRPKVAAVFTEFRFRSHAFNILENFFEPYLFRGQLTDPGCDVVSFYADQFPADDMARDVSRRLGIPLYKTIGEALCLGGKELAVDAVLSIGEHGDYPYNDRGQKMYPRKRFFDDAVAVMQRSGRYVPLFNDKHLSYRFDWAREMYETARKHQMPLMAGSSVPLAQRRPPLEIPAGAEIEEAVSIHGGGVETYDFHALELLQSMVEARRGGETGIRRVEFLTGDAFEQAKSQGRWSADLVEAAMQAERDMHARRQSRPVERPAKAAGQPPRDEPAGPHALVLTYHDGLRASVLKVGSTSNRWNFACRLKGEAQPRATALFNGPWGNRCLFKALSHAIQYLFTRRQEPYPIERTLLVSGILEAAMRSREQGRALETPELKLAYQPIDFRALREDGGSWKVITVDTPQTSGFEPGDGRFVRG